MSTESLSIITGNSKVLRSINRTRILNIIRETQPISRSSIAEITGLNKSTVSSIISDLLNEDLIFELASEDQNVGRNPINLYLKLNKFLVGAINIDSSITRFAIADIDGSIKGQSSIDTDSGNPEKFTELCVAELLSLCRDLNIDHLEGLGVSIDGSIKGQSSIDTDSGNPEKFTELCVAELLSLCRDLNIDHLEGLGVSIAGIVDSKNLIVNFAPNLGWADFNIGKIISRVLPDIKNIAVGNDAKSSALAELWFGNHEMNLSNSFFLSIGAGIGTGIIIQNELMNGEYQASGEFGHMVIFEGGEQCTCGNNGCWEAYASDRAIVSQYLAQRPGNFDHNVDFMAQDIIDLAKENDKFSIEVLKKTGFYLGLGIKKYN